jgi:dipeptidyl aminopeptidase/acylaminoacyl peptidase
MKGRLGAVLLGALVVGVPAAASPAAPRAAAPPTALESLLSAPAHGDLVAAPAGRAVAWAVNDRGRRNLWVADGDPLRARALTSFTDDDGQGLQEIAWSPDGRVLAFARGAGDGASGKTLNPSSAVAEMGQDVWVAFLDGTAARRIGPGRAPALSARGDVAYVNDDLVWLAPVADGAPARLFDPHGNAADLQWTKDGSALAFSVRRGAHSLIGVYRRGRPTLSWVAPSVDRDLYPRWSPDGEQIAFARFENIDSRMKSSGRWGPLDSPWSLQVSDVAENGFSAAREVFRAPARPLGSFPRNAQLLRWVDGERLAFVSEHEDWARLYLADPAAPGAAVALSPTGCEVEDPSASGDGRSLFFAANCGDLERRHVWRATVPARGASPAAAEALTRGTGIETSPVATADGRTIVFHRHDARTPPTPTALALADGATVALVPTTGVDSTRFVTPTTAVFKAPDGLEIHGALFAPASADVARRPAIVHVHGGPTAGQDLLGWNPFFQHLVSRGYVVLGLNYRGGAGYGRPFREVLDQGLAGGAEYQDVVAAAAYLRSRPDVDPARIGIFGASYGGYLTMMALARNSDLFAAGVTECGIYDMSTNPRGTSRGGEAGRLARENSAAGSIDKWRSPVLIIHGDDDPGVDFDGQTIALVRALRARKVPFEQLVFPDEGHSSSGWAHGVRARQATADFFHRRLGGRP